MLEQLIPNSFIFLSLYVSIGLQIRNRSHMHDAHTTLQYYNIPKMCIFNFISNKKFRLFTVLRNITATKITNMFLLNIIFWPDITYKFYNIVEIRMVGSELNYI